MTVVASASADNARTFAASGVHVADHLVEVPRVDQRSDLGLRIERISHAQAPRPLGNLVDELIVNRGLHEKPARRGAALAIEAVDHENHGIESAIEVRVVEHDDRILAAKLEVIP